MRISSGPRVVCVCAHRGLHRTQQQKFRTESVYCSSTKKITSYLAFGTISSVDIPWISAVRSVTFATEYKRITYGVDHTAPWKNRSSRF